MASLARCEEGGDSGGGFIQAEDRWAFAAKLDHADACWINHDALKEIKRSTACIGDDGLDDVAVAYRKPDIFVLEPCIQVTNGFSRTRRCCAERLTFRKLHCRRLALNRCPERVLRQNLQLFSCPAAVINFCESIFNLRIRSCRYVRSSRGADRLYCLATALHGGAEDSGKAHPSESFREEFRFTPSRGREGDPLSSTTEERARFGGSCVSD